MKLLIQHGADVAARDNSNSTPLHLASFKGGAESVQLLIQHKADVNVRNKENLTPLHLVFKGNPYPVDGQRTWMRNVVNEFDCEWNASVKAVDVLVRHGADNARNKDNLTPLHLVSSLWKRGSEKACLLLAHGADVDAKDDTGRTPYEIASSTAGPTSHGIMELISDHRNRVRGQ
ncbi:ankyrin repeat-containing domain protein [Lactarius pseudohatsudake]|nr:ankyrin repeat-containing domain protein [Lactarius pseudohatsudake]